MKRVALSLILTITMTSAAFAANDKWLKAKTDDNLSMMAYAEQNHERLAAKASRWFVDPDAGFNMAEWRYIMPDGTIVSCMRGVVGNTFSYRCREF